MFHKRAGAGSADESSESSSLDYDSLDTPTGPKVFSRSATYIFGNAEVENTQTDPQPAVLDVTLDADSVLAGVCFCAAGCACVQCR